VEASNLREVVLLGSTGSIGTQAIDVIRRNPERFRVVALMGGGSRVDLLAAQALDLGVAAVGVAAASAAQDLQLAFFAEATRRGYRKGEFAVPKILAGPDAASRLQSVRDGLDAAAARLPDLFVTLQAADVRPTAATEAVVNDALQRVATALAAYHALQ